MDWTPFFATVAGATATVLGLLFIAVQLSIEQISAENINRFRALALSTFNILFLVFFLPVAFLIPSIDLRGKAITMLVIVGFGLYGIFRNWLSVLRGMYFGGHERAWQTFWHFLGPLLAYLFLLRIALQILFGNGGEDLLTAVAWTLVAMFGNGVRNSWDLVIEVTFGRSRISKLIQSKTRQDVDRIQKDNPDRS